MSRHAARLLLLIVWLVGGLSYPLPVNAQPDVALGRVTTQGSSLVAGESGASLSFEGGVKVHLAPLASVSHHEMDVWFPKLGLRRAHVLHMKHGFAEVRGTLQRPVVVRSGRLTVASLDSELWVGAASAAATRGRSWIRKQGKWRWLREGHRVQVDATGRVTRASLELPSPRFGSPEVLIAASGSVSFPGFNWSEVEGARSYRLILRRVGDDREIVRTHYQTVPTPSDEAPLVNLRPGRYEAEVYAVDSSGLPGFAGSADLTVVGVLGEGVVALADGSVSAPPRTNLQLEYVEGLEMSLTDSKEWFDAVPSLMLQQDGGLTVHLKHPGSPHVAVLNAHVHTPPSALVIVGPKTAVWPKDEVTASIHLGARSGLTQETVRIEAFVGTTPIDLSWAAHGDSLTTTIPTIRGPGPWVIRVVVYDAVGEEVGRDHLEVAGPVPARRASNSWHPASR